MYRDRKLASSAMTWAKILAIGAAAGMIMSAAARADEVQAKSLFKAMSDYLAAQKAISLEYDSTLEIVTKEQQKLGLASSGAVTLNRPDKIRATRIGGFTNVELVFDGKTVTLLGKTANFYHRPKWPEPSITWLTRCVTNTPGLCQRRIC